MSPGDPRNLYVTSDLKLEEIAELMKGVRGCSLPRLKERSAAEGWVNARHRYRREIADELLQEQGNEALAAGREQLSHARRMQTTGMGLVAASGHAIMKLGGVEKLFGEKPAPRDIIQAIKVGTEVMAMGMQLERELLGGRLAGDLPILVFNVRKLPEKAEQADDHDSQVAGGNGNAPGGNGGPPSADLDDES